MDWVLIALILFTLHSFILTAFLRTKYFLLTSLWIEYFDLIMDLSIDISTKILQLAHVY